MSNRSAPEILQESFLEVRAKLLEVAATLDRIDHAATVNGESVDDAKRDQIDQAIHILLRNDATRANDLQLLFSRDYDSQWRKRMKV